MKHIVNMGLLCLLWGNSWSQEFKPWMPPLKIPDDRSDIPLPPPEFKNVWADAYSRQVTQPITRAFDFSRWLRVITGNPKQAMNVNEFDEVENSSWFSNRNTIRPLTPEEIRRGPRTIAGPDTSGLWTIFKVKSEGMAPGFWIEDAAGNKFIIKPEIKNFPEVGTSAENITTLLYYAAGYNTPENYLAEFKLDRLKIGEGVNFVDSRGVKRLMTPKDLDEILARTHVRPDGRVRATASRFIKGKPVGSFSFTGTREGDPNDIVPHQHRRELRGLYVFASWTNHHDLNSGNFFDSYVEDEGKRYIRHYLLDFSSSLGASLFGAQPKVRGYEPLMNPIYTFVVNPVLNAFRAPKWETDNPIKNNSVGRFNNHIFNPGKFKINYPLEAFSRLTNRDGYWGAKLVKSFTDDQIRSVVQEGFYSDSTSPGILADILIERRDIIARYWYARVNPLENFRFDSQHYRLYFSDQALQDNIANPEKTIYQFSLRHNGESVEGNALWQSADSCLKIQKPDVIKKPFDQIEVSIKTIRGSEKPGPYIKVYLNSLDGGPHQFVGFERE